MNHPESYKGQRVVVLGLARSGVSVAKVFHAIGAKVVVNDRKDRDSSPEASELETLGITVVCGGHPEGLVTADTALLVKNPGIPYTVEPIVRASELGVEIVTEVEVASWLSPAPIIGITGSNGKTTTTTLTGELLRAAGLHPIVAGNIGTPLCEAAIAAEPDNWLVAELSSFQLKGTAAFRPRVAVLLNLAETHLDYHGGMDDYIASKAKIFANQTAGDTAVLNWDDPVCRQLAGSVKAKPMPFSLKEKLAKGVCVEPPFRDGEAEEEAPARTIVWRRPEGETAIVGVAELGIPGRHNTANALAAIAACLAAGADPAALAAPLRDFRGVEHRLEFVAVKHDVRYYNDSKATNPTATTMSVRSLKGRIVLLAGGLDRGSDYMELLPLFKERVAAVVAIGETRGKIAKVAELAGLRAVKTVDPLEDAEATLRQAVREAASLARPGDVVLLSPACASWDMFESYEQRGRIFKQSAHTL
ncbi:UDP-N-acetylmuramoyl-L-alanine--D-glutamate ligase [uncultured Paenibacillus sp.]|uniref:UDP-N-acetylmuramoyl-L-alanine--D-glutamate ligase n=1 Tax=uncultured Paenibacillus sp. TaxID=227322 RepID=UPI0028D170FB|nr:UDP-N-acetylmuramoyl-L-alanine--D-glutamate ligase [uncultured Paenibacillus sp.]